MLKLIRLEIKKFKLGSNLKGIIIANLSILALIIMLGVIQIYEEDIIFSDSTVTLMVIDLFVKDTFAIYSSVLLAKLIIEEYKNKTMSLMFMYPIRRRDLFIAKLIIVIGFTFINILISNVFIFLAVGLIDQFLDIVIGNFEFGVLLSEMPKLLFNATVTSFMVLIPLYFGTKKMSVPSTIVSSIIIVAVISSGENGVSLSSIPLVVIALAVLGGLIGGGVIRKLENQDVL